MKHEIEHYEPKVPSVVAIGERRVRAFVGDQHPHLGSTLWVGNTPTRIVSLAGNRRVEAIAFDTGAFAVADGVRCSDDVAGWPAPRPGPTALEDLGFEPGRAAGPRRTPAAVVAHSTGIGVIDSYLPLAIGGVTLLLDCGAPDECTDRLLRTLPNSIVGASSRVIPDSSHQVLDESGLALAVAADWAANIDDSALVIEAPPFDVDALLDADAYITTVVRIRLLDGLEILAETLDLGRCDTQILLRSDGTIDLTRSSSRLGSATLNGARFSRLGAIREHREIFGEFDIDDDDLAVLREADELEAGLIR